MVHAERVRRAIGAALLVGASLAAAGGAGAEGAAADGRAAPGTVPASLQFLPIVSSVTALLAVFFGPLVQLTISKRQQRASVVSSNRVRFIDDFRREVAELIAVSHLLETERHNFGQLQKEGVTESQVSAYRSAFHASLSRVNTLVQIIGLRLELGDAAVSVDKEIWASMGRLVQLDVRKFGELGQFEKAFFAEVETLRTAVQARFSAEWKRVEALE